jgi:hypothetical protein
MKVSVTVSFRNIHSPYVGSYLPVHLNFCAALTCVSSHDAGILSSYLPVQVFKVFAPGSFFFMTRE